MHNLLQLAGEIIDGRRLTRNDDLEVLLTADLAQLCEGADRIRQALCGGAVSLCTIINGKSGRCSEDCKFCAQSACHSTGIETYSFLAADPILREARQNAAKGVHRFCIVTAGKALQGAEFAQALETYRRLHAETELRLCASHGLLTEAQLVQLQAAGVERCHCNLETSRRYFPEICTTHTYDQKIACLKNARKAGLSLCSGGIIGMGETWEDRLDMAVTLSEVGADSIPLNMLIPIEGTPFAHLERLSEEEILRTVAIFRYLNPQAQIRLAAGRSLLADAGARALRSGANAAITGDMLTTSGTTIRSDVEMIRGMGVEVGRE